MMSLTFGLFTQVSGSGPLGPLVDYKSISGTNVDSADPVQKPQNMATDRINTGSLLKFLWKIQ